MNLNVNISDLNEQYQIIWHYNDLINYRSLHKIIQDLRRQYSGCIPISRQENISKLLREMNEDKRKLTQELKGNILNWLKTFLFASILAHLRTSCSLSLTIYDLGAEEKREEAETQASELLIKKHSLDELLVEIGSKGPRSAAKTREQVMMIVKFEINLNFMISIK